MTRIQQQLDTAKRDTFYVVVYNAQAGRMRGRVLAHIQNFFAKKDASYTLTDLSYIDWDDIRAKVREYDDVRFIAAGGDGTLRLVLEGLWKERLLKDVSVAFVPLGSANVTALSLRLPFVLPRALERAVSGTPRQVDLGLINNAYVFFIVASFGALSNFVISTQRGAKKRWGGFAYLFNIHKLITSNFRKEYFDISFNEEGKQRVMRGHSLVICNHLNVSRLKPLRGIAVDDQKLHTIILKYETLIGLLRAILGFFWGNKDSNVLHHAPFTEATYTLTNFNGAIHLDGDAYMNMGDTLTFSVLPRAVTLIV